MGEASGPPGTGRTIRLRFTVLYAVLFLASGAGLLALTYLVAGSQIATTAPALPPADGQGGLADAREAVAGLQGQLRDLEATQARRLLTSSLIALAVMALVSVLLGRVVAKRVLRPLRTITSATRRISAANLHERLAVPGPADEVKHLADTIDDLLDRLEDSFAAQRAFVANASHELRTPLTTMRASLDVAMAKPQPAPQTVALADRLRTELDRVDQLLEALLVLARARHAHAADDTAVSLRELLSEAVTARAADIASRKLTVHLGDPRDAALTRGSRTLLARMVENLVDNAVVHNHHGGWIRVATGTGDGAVELTVATGGPVLRQEHVDRLTEPFQRLGTDRTGSDDGSGLGLSIVAAVADAHDGRLRLLAHPDGGLHVTISLPRAESSVVPA